MTRTVRARIAVAVDAEGNWTVSDGSMCANDGDKLASVADDYAGQFGSVPCSVAVHFIEATIPLPEPAPEETVQGEVVG